MLNRCRRISAEIVESASSTSSDDSSARSSSCECEYENDFESSLSNSADFEASGDFPAYLCQEHDDFEGTSGPSDIESGDAVDEHERSRGAIGGLGNCADDDSDGNVVDDGDDDDAYAESARSGAVHPSLRSTIHGDRRMLPCALSTRGPFNAPVGVLEGLHGPVTALSLLLSAESTSNSG
jgi:hypothetical protein